MPSLLPASTLLPLFLSGCGDGTSEADHDADGDGWTVAEGDCDDGDPDVHPEADEVVADGVDQDCDGGDTCYVDVDGDGYGALETLTSEDLDCTDAGESLDSADCDDADPDVHPGVQDPCGDGIDQNCDGVPSCRFEGTWSIDGATTRLDGHETDDRAGSAIAVGDLDGDGAPEIATTAPDADSGRGVVLVSLDAGPGAVGTVEVVVGDPGSRYDPAIAVGDLTGDGVADLTVGVGDASSGVVWVLPGPIDSDRDLATSAWSWSHDDRGFGTSLGVGDLDGDGDDDLAVWCKRPWEADPLWVLRSPVTDASNLEAGALSERDFFGDTRMVLEDADGDGLAEVITGQRDGLTGVDGDYQRGRLDVFDDPLGSEEPSATFYGDRIAAVFAVGDLDGDGQGDVVATCHFDSDGFLVFEGPLVGVSSASEHRASATSTEGIDTLALGDFDGDGRDDVLVGAPDADESGRAWLFYGPLEGSLAIEEDAEVTFLAVDQAASVGASASFSDLDGDGFADLLLGASFRQSTHAGAVVSFPGGPGF